MLRERSDILKPTLSALKQRLDGLASKPASHFADLARVSESIKLAMDAAQSALTLVPDALATVAEYVSCADVPGGANDGSISFHQLVLAELFELPPDSPVPSADFMVSVQYLMCFDNLTQMRLSNNRIGDEGVRLLADGLARWRMFCSASSAPRANCSRRAPTLLPPFSTAPNVLLPPHLPFHPPPSTPPPRNSRLLELELISCGIGAQGAMALGMALGGDGAHGLTTLALSANRIGEDGAVALALALETNGTLSVIELEDCLIGPAGAAAMARMLQNNSALESIDLSDNLMCGVSRRGDGARDASGVTALITALADNRSLRSINLLCNGLGDGHRESLLELVAACGQGELQLQTACGLHSANTAPDFGAKGLCHGDLLMLLDELTMRGELSPVTSLNLGASEVDDDAAAALARAIHAGTPLASLELDASRLSVQGALALAEGIVAAPHAALQTLVLHGRDAGDVNTPTWCAQLPVSALTGQLQLDTIDLAHSGVSPLAAVVLSKLIEANTSLQYLILAGNPIGDAAAAYVMDGASQAGVQGLVLHRCEITASGAAALGLQLAQAEETVGTISFDLAPLPVPELRGAAGAATSLDLSGQELSDVSAAFISELLKHNGTLTKLNLSNNRFSDEAGRALDQAIRLNCSLAVVQLGGNAFSDGVKASLKRLRRNSVRQGKRPVDLQL
jgi:Ran GTPase-activating protein (RanGAP) involved in mRNA processing and transport